MAFSFLPREDAYFTLFIEMAGKIEEASSILMEMLDSNEADQSPFTKRIKDVEHACDTITHEITTKLNKSFITPFDREDIYTLAVALDDICDYIDAGRIVWAWVLTIPMAALIAALTYGVILMVERLTGRI